MALLELSITTLLQRANAYHIVITRFIFALRILCKQASGVRGTFPSSPVFKRSKTLHVYMQALCSVFKYRLESVARLAESSLTKRLFSAVRRAAVAFIHTSGLNKLWMYLVVMISPS